MILKYITFVFENCESITISGNDVGTFEVDDIHSSIRQVGCNSIEEINTVNDFAIEIFSSANKYDDNIKQSIFDRFSSYNDIVAIKFIVESPSTGYDLNTNKSCELSAIKKYDYWLNWPSTDISDQDCSQNCNQKTYISQPGNLYIVVSEEKDIDYFFNKDVINDLKIIENIKSAYAVANETTKVRPAKEDKDTQAIQELQETLDKTRNQLQKALDTMVDILGKNINDTCSYCKYHIDCSEKTCANYEEGKGTATDDDTGKIYNWKWSCQDFDFGTCSRLVGTPCEKCKVHNLKGNFEWKELD